MVLSGRPLKPRKSDLVCSFLSVKNRSERRIGAARPTGSGLTLPNNRKFRKYYNFHLAAARHRDINLFMQTTAVAGLEDSYLFPTKQGEFLPLIGQGFDLIGGQAVARNAFDPPPSTEMITIKREQAFSEYCAIYDKETFSDAATIDFQTSGGGWGVQTGMSLSASARVDSTSTTFTVHLNAAKTVSQSIVKTSTKLSHQGATDLRSLGASGFVTKYGTHFIAGYVYGMSCKASYNMRFSSLDMMLAFTATYSESASELNFSDSTKASLSNVTATSKTKYSESVNANFVGFHGSSPASFDELITLKKDYDASAASAETAVSVIVMPWSYLDQVSQSSSRFNCDNQDSLSKLINSLTYIKNSCATFIENGLYVGNTQLQRVRTVKTSVEQELNALLKVVSDATASGTSVTVKDGDQLSVDGTLFSYAEPLMDDMRYAMEHFAISWKTQIKGGSNRLCTDLKNLAGAPVQVSSDGFTVDGTLGTWFTWSIQGNDAWEGTRNTQKMAYQLSYMASGWNLAIVLDREQGSMQCWARGVGQPLSQNPRSNVQVIRGSDCSKDCDDPTNSDALVWEGQGGFFRVSPI
jgi:hypothetical protein